MYNDNWNEIAEHVGTKSKAQCILHFVRLPMEDGILENVEVPNTSRTSNSSSRDDRGGLHSTVNGDLPGFLKCLYLHFFQSLWWWYRCNTSTFCCTISGAGLQEADMENRLPFSNSGNPVMALVGDCSDFNYWCLSYMMLYWFTIEFEILCCILSWSMGSAVVYD